MWLFIVPEPAHILGGDSFVQFVIGLNISLLAVKSLKERLDWMWTQLQGSLKASENDALEQLKRANHPEWEKQSKKLTDHFSNRASGNIDLWQGRIWRFCAVLAGATFVAGLTCLYLDRYCKYNLLLACPWPLYWILSRLYCDHLKRKTKKGVKQVLSFLTDDEADKPPIARVVKNALSKAESNKTNPRISEGD